MREVATLRKELKDEMDKNHDETRARIESAMTEIKNGQAALSAEVAKRSKDSGQFELVRYVVIGTVMAVVAFALQLVAESFKPPIP